MSLTKERLKILQEDFEKTLISRLSDRPNVGRQYGGQAMSSEMLKARYDASSRLIRDRFNALIDALAGVDENGERTDGVADLIMTGIGEYTLSELFAALKSGEAMQSIGSGIDGRSVKGCLQDMIAALEAMEKDYDALDEAVGEAKAAAANVKQTVGEAVTSAVEQVGDKINKAIEDAIDESRMDEAIADAAEMADHARSCADQAIAAAETADAARQSISNVTRTFSNALRGSASGAGVVKMEDVSPVAHDLGVKVASKNLIPYPYAQTTKELNGITFTDNGDGSVTIKGTCTEPFSTGFALTRDLSLIDEVTYTVSNDKENKDRGVVVYFVYKDSTADDPDKDIAQSNSVTWKSYYTFTSVIIQINKENPITDVTVWPQLEVGTTATEYVPYVDVSAIKVVKSGKNLCNVDAMLNDVLTKDGDVYALTKISNTKRLSKEFSVFIPANTPLSPSVKFVDENLNNSLKMQFVLKTNEGKEKYMSIKKDGTTTLGKSFEVDITGISIYVDSSEADGAFVKFKDLQIEVGDTITDYELYAETVAHTPNADGTVEGVMSLSPTTVIMSDVPNVNICVDYNRDLNKAFHEIYQMIAGLA